MTRKEREFVEMVWTHYKREGRHNLPWRKTRNPYCILVSEVMLQQTQVERVVPKYREFLKTFPTVRALADVPLGDVLRVWQGLGYNRRAKLLHECAQVLVDKFRGLTPKSYKELLALPGVGPYTAGAILAFAYNIPVPMIETNIRTVYLHHFFKQQVDVADSEVLKFVLKTLDREHPREWYYALMDYGTHLKRTIGNQNTRSKHHAKQSTFRGSNREVRGAILKVLTSREETVRGLAKILSFPGTQLTAQLEKLSAEGLVTKRMRKYSLPH